MSRCIVFICSVPFPSIVLLASEGHCTLGIVEDIDKFHRLDEAFDKSAHEMTLHEHPLVQDMTGGAAIGYLACEGDEKQYQSITSKYSAKTKDYSFSFGSSNTDEPKSKDFAACIQASIVRHIETLVHQAILF
ncbi:unnamed protein product [Rotaria sordida]|uniref:Gcp-like domain-containing protein n=2 Tax=Rotaria sordida TaxID=392033 RepID=A0A820AEI5_9BILA|nr:unnamed protein product [Rotaria sordida]